MTFKFEEALKATGIMLLIFFVWLALLLCLEHTHQWLGKRRAHSCPVNGDEYDCD